MKKLTFLFIFLLPFLAKAQLCGPFTTHAPITAASGQTYTGYAITATSTGNGITIPNGVHDVTIMNCSIDGGLNGIYAQGNNYNIHVYSNFIKNSARGFQVRNGLHDIDFHDNQVYNILDPKINTTGGGNAVQFADCHGINLKIYNNKIYHDANSPYIGDQISLVRCTGTTDSWIDIYGNWIRNGSTNSLGFAGINIADISGSYQTVHNNIVINSGMQGIQIADGTGDHLTVINNDIYSDPVGVSNEALSVKPGKTVVTATTNRLNWRSASNGHWFNKYTTMSPVPIGWAGNIDDNAGVYINAHSLPDPLWPNCVLPPHFSYFVSAAIYMYGVGIGTLVPANTGGAPASYAISPALPAGLSFSTATGVISGTPTTVHSATTYTVTATNASGNATATVTITIIPYPMLILANSFVRSFGTENPPLTFQILAPGFVNGDTQSSLTTQPTVTTAATITSGPGDYDIIVSGAVNPNYSYTYIKGKITVYLDKIIRKTFKIVAD